MSAGPLSSATLTNDALSLSDLENNKPVTSVEKETAAPEEPVVLDHRMTMTIRSLRHLDYVLSVGEQDLVDELESEDMEEDYGFESGDEGDGRSSYASSVAVLDDDYEACETPTSDAPHESPIVEGEEDEEEDENHEGQDSEPKEGPMQQAEKEAEAHEKPEEPSQAAEEVQQPEEEQESSEQNHDEAENSEQTANTAVAMAMSVHGDSIRQDAALAEEVEVVEAAPIAEVHAMMLNQYELQNAKPDAVVEQEPKQRLQRAHTTVPSSGDKAIYQNQLLQQMQDLHNVAETTYQVARANTEAAFKERDSGRISSGTGNLRGVRTFSQPFAFNVVGLRSTRAMTVGINK
ncbi:hypothetical protein ON010_g15094 [Phytophthora cinnamomi]|nr:hypothetical protein ON010_g15094 [Phytophthora cinnamomi]